MAVAFIPKEAHAEETRVAGTPDTVKALIKAGLQVQVEAGAGLAAGYPDQDYTDAGAEIVADGAAARAQADLSIAIRPPEDASNFKRGGILDGFEHQIIEKHRVAFPVRIWHNRHKAA